MKPLTYDDLIASFTGLQMVPIDRVHDALKYLLSKIDKDPEMAYLYEKMEFKVKDAFRI